MLDNFSAHKHPNVRAWAAANDVELVFLPTCGSWLNWIESEFAALRYFALNGTDHRRHGEQTTATEWLTGDEPYEIRKPTVRPGPRVRPVQRHAGAGDTTRGLLQPPRGTSLRTSAPYPP